MDKEVNEKINKLKKIRELLDEINAGVNLNTKEAQLPPLPQSPAPGPAMGGMGMGGAQPPMPMGGGMPPPPGAMDPAAMGMPPGMENINVDQLLEDLFGGGEGKDKETEGKEEGSEKGDVEGLEEEDKEGLGGEEEEKKKEEDVGKGTLSKEEVDTEGKDLASEIIDGLIGKKEFWEKMKTTVGEIFDSQNIEKSVMELKNTLDMLNKTLDRIMLML